MNKKKIKFEENSKEIEKIIDLLEKGQLSIEESVVYFEKAMDIIKINQQHIEEAKQKIDIITQNQKPK